ncbi:MAG: division/cell wall cluster transcriptional repressor MraZ [Flavobacteriaceae bacterium]
MTHLIGQFECKADSKGRVNLPVALKQQLVPILEKGFVLKRSVFQTCLELYPKEAYDELMMKIVAKNQFSRNYDTFLRNFLAGSQELSIEEHGRVQIPKPLISFAQIKKEVVLASAINRIEIWDKARYEAVLQEGQDVYADLAEAIFSDNDNLS